MSVEGFTLHDFVADRGSNSQLNRAYNNFTTATTEQGLNAARGIEGNSKAAQLARQEVKDTFESVKRAAKEGEDVVAKTTARLSEKASTGVAERKAVTELIDAATPKAERAVAQVEGAANSVKKAGILDKVLKFVKGHKVAVIAGAAALTLGGILAGVKIANAKKAQAKQTENTNA